MDNHTLELTVQDPQGLHARPAATLVKYMTGLPDHVAVTLEKDGRVADARSIIGIMTLAAGQGAKLLVRVKSTGGELDPALVNGIFEATRAAVEFTTKRERGTIN